MKLSLVVMSPGKMEGRSIPVAQSEFLIGRDPQCHLRPTSPLISKRHCAVTVRGGKAFIRDFESTNGTQVNDQAVQGELELRNQDLLRVGPLEFRVVLETAAPTPRPAPMPSGQRGVQDDDTAAAMLLSLDDDPATTGANVDSNGVPTGSTIMEILAPQADTPPPPGPGNPKADKAEAAKQAAGNTSNAAKAILEKYMRRPRG